MNSKLVIGISSRALFDLSQSHKIFEKEGIDAYRSHQIKNENEILDPGEAYNLVTKILKINDLYDSENRVEVILLSRNTHDTGLRIFNSIEAHGLDITRAVFCGGESPHKYVKDFNINLFLSSSSEDVKMAIESNVASANIISPNQNSPSEEPLLKIAFDGDADRIGVVDNKGSIIWADQLMALFLPEIINPNDKVLLSEIEHLSNIESKLINKINNYQSNEFQLSEIEKESNKISQKKQTTSFDLGIFMMKWSNKFVFISLLVISAIALSKQAWA